LFLVGYTKGRLLENDGLKSGTEMALVAGSAALIGYVIGKVAGLAFGLEVR
jgi:VIT1/CCC1 family predicted Fe2+/Mn2+ transporter